VDCSIARVRHHTFTPGGLSTRNVEGEEDYSSVDWLTPVAAKTDGISALAIGMK
jgi:hypothetical protein